VRQIIPSKRFERDLRRMVRRGKDIAKLQAVVEKLQVGEALEPRHGPHPLAGDWKPYWDCHIEPDWLLVYHVTDEAVWLVRTGTHADLF
jgi:mRNA interferase YafQ